ncbi:hypothetical protein [Halococcus agarilyticus]|nr:hypothetical protein [Halococcus agarilyticus]
MFNDCSGTTVGVWIGDTDDVLDEFDSPASKRHFVTQAIMNQVRREVE